MISIFDDTPEEKEQWIVDMLQRRYGWKQIMKECHVSPNTISSVKKKFFGSIEDDTRKSASQISKETQALKLFKEGWKPLDIAIKLDLAADSVFQIQKKFYQLIGLDEFNQAYEQINGNLGPFLQLINSMNRLGMNVRQILDAVKYGDALPNLQNLYSKLGNEIRHLDSYRYSLHSQLNLMANQIDDYKFSLEYYINENEQKKNELLVLDYQIKDCENFIQKLDNQEGYQRIKKESTEQAESIIKNNSMLVAVTVTSTLEAIRRYPYNQELLHDLSARRGYSTSNQQSWMHSHATQLLQLTEQVEIEIAEQITNVTMSNIRARNDESQISQMT